MALVRPEPPFPLLLTKTPATQAEQTVKADSKNFFLDPRDPSSPFSKQMLTPHVVTAVGVGSDKMNCVHTLLFRRKGDERTD